MEELEDKDELEANSISRSSTYGTWRAQKGWNPLLITDAEGVYIKDASGKNYIDFSSQLMCVNLGHKNRHVIDKIKDQADKLAYVAPSFNTEIRSEISRKLKEILPNNLDKYFFSTSGTEANEAAIKIIRMFHSRDGKLKIISMYNSYHGSTGGSIRLTGDFRRRAGDFTKTNDGIIHAPGPYCYRCPLGLKYPECDIKCADYIEYVIKNEGSVGGIVVEPVTGTNGVIVPPEEYMPRLREITRENGVELVADEVMSGWGRIGEWFAVNKWKVKPDILTTAKGMSNAAVPLALTATKAEISEYFEEHFFAHGHTFEAHPLTLAAGSAAIDEYHRLDLIDYARELGKKFGKRLEEMKERHASIGDVRYAGLFGAIELVRNRETKEPFNSSDEKLNGKSIVVDRVAKDAMGKGVFFSPWISHFVLAPPLIITEEEMNRALDVLDESLKIADTEVVK